MVQAAIVGGFVRRLDVDGQEIVLRLQAGNGCGDFPGVVRVDLTGGAGDMDRLEAAQRRDAVDQRDSADDRAGVPVAGGKVWQLYSGALGPEPDALAGSLPSARRCSLMGW